MAASAALLLALAAVSASSALAATVEGQLFGRDGAPLADTKVHLVERASSILGRPSAEIALIESRTDRHGFFRFDLGPRSLGGTYLVRVVGGEGWDRLRYALPDDVDVTRALKSHGRAVAAIVVEDAAGWSEILREIVRVGGPGSPRGAVLRRLGLPPESIERGGGVVEWRYPGATFIIRDGELVEASGPEARP